MFRFFLGIGIGAEYACGAVAASEQSEETEISKYAQNRWLALSTSTMFPAIMRIRFGIDICQDTMLDVGFVAATFVPLVLFWM